jgi:hypothetical protein
VSIKEITRRDFGKITLAAAGALAFAACRRIVSSEPQPTPELTPKPSEEKLASVQGSLLRLPETVVNGGRKSINTYLNELVRTAINDLNLSIPYLNNPAMLSDNDEEPSLLTGQKEPGQSQAELALQPLAPEVRLISGGQFVLPLSEQAAAKLPKSQVVRESNLQGGINSHLVYQTVTLHNGRMAVLIPGGRDPDHNVNTAVGNYNRGNILIVLPPTEQGKTSLFAQVDTGSNWQAQYRPETMLKEKGGLTDELISYVLYNPDAQRSEQHGLSAMESMYRGPNCQGQGCRTVSDQGTPLAEMAGIGVYIVQISPQGDAVDLLSATVVTDNELGSIFPNR